MQTGYMTTLRTGDVKDRSWMAAHKPSMSGSQGHLRAYQHKAELKAKSCRLVKQYDEITPRPKGKDDVTHTPSKENPDSDIIKAIKGMGRLVSHSTLAHTVPFCPRSNTPLLYKVRIFDLFCLSCKRQLRQRSSGTTGPDRLAELFLRFSLCRENLLCHISAKESTESPCIPTISGNLVSLPGGG